MNTYKKCFYRIREVAELLDVQEYTLRYWGKTFGISPQRTAANQRRYTPQDVEQLRLIRTLLYERKLTTKAVQAYLAKQENSRKNYRCDTPEMALALINVLKSKYQDEYDTTQILNTLSSWISAESLSKIALI